MNYFKNSNQLVIILTTILVIILLMVGGFFVYTKILTNSEDIGEEEVTSTATSSDAYQIPMGVTVPGEQQTQNQDPTAEWLTFSVTDSTSTKKPTSTSTSTSTASTTLFSFKYPKDLEVKQNKNNLILSSATVTSTQLVLNWETTTKSLKDYVKDVDKLSAKAWEGKPSIQVVTSTDKAMIGSLPAIVREQKLLAADLSEYIVYFKNSSTVYSIGIIAPQLNQNLVGFLALFINTLKLGN